MKLKIGGFIVGNGLRVVTIPEPGAPIVRVTMRYHVGAKDDPAGKEGMAHLVEHLLFLPSHEGRRVEDRLHDAATFSNAFTSIDATTYVARGKPERLADIFQAEAIRLAVRCQSITDDMFKREREVVLNELREKDTAMRTHAALQEALFPAGHPYRRIPGGTTASVGSITRDQACAFIDQHYVPANAVLVVSGAVTDAEVDAALGKMLGRVPKKPGRAASAIPPVAGKPGTINTKAPVDDPFVLVTWPLPTDVAERAKVRAVARMASSRVNMHVKGAVYIQEWGGEGARVLGIVIEPAEGESIGDAAKGAERGVSGLAQWFEKESFARSQQRASYDLFAGLEDADARDRRIADEVLSGRAAGDTIGAEIQAIGGLTRDAARGIARSALAYSRATIVAVEPSGEDAAPVQVDATIQEDDRRAPSDGKGADRPAEHAPTRHALAGAQVRTLDGGLKVVLLPESSVPTIDIRLVFPVGSADEPRDRRGAAMLAANGLTWADSDGAALDNFFVAGGVVEASVTDDATTFAVRGLAVNLDYLLTGLERLVRNGRYDGMNVDETVAALKKRAAKDDGSDMEAQWRAGLFGSSHPYADASVLEKINFGAIGAGALNSFRDRHYKPGGATLIIAGGFDAAAANRWVDFLFGDWRGAGAQRAGRRAAAAARRIATSDDGAQLGVAIGIHATGGPALRARERIAAAMLDVVIADVREQLAASYGVHASLMEQRLATWYELAGWIDAKRAPKAFGLLRARVEELRDGGAKVAPIFVAARRRVLDELAAVDVGATALAEAAAHNAALGRPVQYQATLLEQVRAVTLADMTDVLDELDLARAVILLRGSSPSVTGSFEALGLKPE